MSNWRDQVLGAFTPQVARLTLVADPDGLLLEERVLEGIRARGFELIPFEDPVAFRYLYEARYRSRWDRDEKTDLVVVLRTQAGHLDSLPYDLLQAGRRLSFSLADIFPAFSYPVVAALERGDLDALYAAQQRYAPSPLGDNATKDFVLRHVFEVAPELIRSASDLLRALLRRHYRGMSIPAILDERLIQLLRQERRFDEWPLESIVPDREAFFAFLQERWPAFLDRLAGPGERSLRDDGEGYHPASPGPIDLPFDHHDVRVYIDNLFVEGVLGPVDHVQAQALAKTWASVGVRSVRPDDQARRTSELLESLRQSLPSSDARHGEWLRFARPWAELIVLLNQPDQMDHHWSVVREEFHSLQGEVDAAFSAWLTARYAGLINLPPAPPSMLHQLPRFLARLLEEQRNARAALLVVDGLAMDQWLVVREALLAKEPAFRFRERALFAWVPSITSVSRQAIFAGRPPALFPDSIGTTEREPALWGRFWADQGLGAGEIMYAKGLGSGGLKTVAESLCQPRVRVAGLVIDAVDRIMHGMTLGTAGMHNQVRQWSDRPYLASLLDLLLARGFTVFVTSDHGNIEARGCGRPAEGAIADLRGERVRVYPNAALRDRVHERFPQAAAWEPMGLPDSYLPLLAPGRGAFVREGERIVSHGAAAIEEVIVPLVHVEKRGT